jgi:glutamyl-tRNA reductase
MLAGEPQILRQVGAAYEAASSARLDPLLRLVFQRALHVGHEIRRSTRLGEVRRSIGSLAADQALAHVAEPSRATVLVIGAGEMGKLAVRALARRVGRVLVANRDHARAERVAASGDAEAVPLGDLEQALSRADVLISAADTRGALLTRSLLAPRVAMRPLVLVDIAVPRSVAADARELDGLVYRTVDDLVDTSTAVTPDEIAYAIERCAAEARAFMREWRARAATDAIRDVRATAESLRRAQLARALRRLGHLRDRDRRVVEALSVGLMNSLLHAPTVALREEPSRSESARELFGLRRRP